MTNDNRLRQLRDVVISRDGAACHYCGVETLDEDVWRWLTRSDPLSPSYGLRRTIDHKTPRDRGGRTTLANLVAACLTCNTRKGRKAYLDVMFTVWSGEWAA